MITYGGVDYNLEYRALFSGKYSRCNRLLKSYESGLNLFKYGPGFVLFCYVEKAAEFVTMKR